MSEEFTSSSSSSGRELIVLMNKEEMKKMLECPVCFEIPLSPIYICKNGHIICDECKKKVTKCGMCQELFTNCHNYLHESIIEASGFRCDYSGCGCGKIIAGGRLKKHLEECKFRPITCHFGLLDDCNHSVIKLSEYFYHLKNVHKAVEWIITDGIFSHEYFIKSPHPGSGSWMFLLVKFDEQQFLTYSFWSSGKVVYFCVLIVGDETDASAYSVQISFGLPQSGTTKFEATLTVPVFSIRNYADDLMNLGIVVMTEGSLKLVGSSSRSVGEAGERIKWRVNYKITKSKLISSSTEFSMV